ncbi:MAG TPA: ribosome recycling factor [Dehalococcoidia bacterium]|nr:ribosome recycling factor [Dehalococcoidia bacterium]
MIDEVLLAANTKMGKTIEALRKELATIRTGRATPALVDDIKVDYYGTPTPLKQIATVSVPEARLLLIQPWDRSMLSSIKKAILKSELGLNPTSDIDVIRLTIPQLSEERRKELARAVHKRAEDGRVALRNIRRDALEELRKLEREKEISQDEQKRAQEHLQELTDSFIATVGKVAEDKEAELLEI